jgi:hypothetical protein
MFLCLPKAPRYLKYVHTLRCIVSSTSLSLLLQKTWVGSIEVTAWRLFTRLRRIVGVTIKEAVISGENSSVDSDLSGLLFS